jgi:glycosyltransferase involved in cell wall biosynthesis
MRSSSDIQLRLAPVIREEKTMTQNSDSRADARRRPPRVLFFGAGYERPAVWNRFHWLSDLIDGDIVAPTRPVFLRQEEYESASESDRPDARYGRFRYFEFLSSSNVPIAETLIEVAGYVRITRDLLEQGEHYDLIVAFGFFKTALAGILVKLIYGKKLLIEVPIIPGDTIRYRTHPLTITRLLRACLEKIAIAAILSAADHVKLVFNEQLNGLSRLARRKPYSAFADFSPVTAIEPGSREDYVLLIGTPLYLKGADLALRAFALLQAEFPEERLLIVGSAQGRREIGPWLTCLKGQAGSSFVELRDYVSHADAIETIRAAKVVLIPSRTEAMPRVAVEAMAARKAIVAARVGGIPSYLEDGKTALLCNPGDPDDLARKLRLLLANAALRRQLGERAREDALTRFNEAAYTAQFGEMVAKCVDDSTQQRSGKDSARATNLTPDDTGSA